jgi:membrane protease YdiL (CAAX protease family)
MSNREDPLIKRNNLTKLHSIRKQITKTLALCRQPWFYLTLAVLYFVFATVTLEAYLSFAWPFLRHHLDTPIVSGVVELLETGALILFMHRYFDPNNPLDGFTSKRLGYSLLFGLGLTLTEYGVMLCLGNGFEATRHLLGELWNFWAANVKQNAVLRLLDVFLIAIAEEWAFRGYLMGRLRPLIGDWGALIGSSYLFVLSHWARSDYSLADMQSLIQSSFEYGLLYLLTENLWAPIAAHGVYDFIWESLYQINDQGDVRGHLAVIEVKIGLSVIVVALFIWRLYQIRRGKDFYSGTLRNKWQSWLVGQCHTGWVLPAFLIGYWSYLPDGSALWGKQVLAGTIYKHVLKPVWSILCGVVLFCVLYDARRLIIRRWCSKRPQWKQDEPEGDRSCPRMD